MSGIFCNLVLGFSSAAGLLEERPTDDGAGALLCLVVCMFELMPGLRTFCLQPFQSILYQRTWDKFATRKAAFQKCLMLLAVVILSFL